MHFEKEGFPRVLRAGGAGLVGGSRELLRFAWQELEDEQKILYFLYTILQCEVNALFYFLKHI